MYQGNTNYQRYSIKVYFKTLYCSAVQQTWKMSINLHEQIFFNPKFYPERVNCTKVKIGMKQQIMHKIPILLLSLPSFLFGIQKKTLSDLFYSIFNNKFFHYQHHLTKKICKIVTDSAFLTKQRIFKAKILPQLLKFTRTALMTFSMFVVQFSEV